MDEPNETAVMRQRIADLELRLAKMEGRGSMNARSRKVVGKLVPADATGHFRAAGREQLLGIRSLVDHWINRLDEGDSAPRPITGGSREEIPID